MTCHYSDWLKIKVLPNKLTTTEANFTKEHFTRFGISDCLVMDNGPQFINTEYKQFTFEQGFGHVTSSPYWPQENDKAKAAVKIVKLVYQKNKDIHVLHLDYTNTPQQGQGHSPTQRLIFRHARGILLMTPRPLQPEIVYPHQEQNHIMTEIWVERHMKKFSLTSGYIPNLILSTSILPGLMTL